MVKPYSVQHSYSYSSPVPSSEQTPLPTISKPQSHSSRKFLIRLPISKFAASIPPRIATALHNISQFEADSQGVVIPRPAPQQPQHQANESLACDTATCVVCWGVQLETTVLFRGGYIAFELSALCCSEFWSSIYQINPKCWYRRAKL